jgi:hypothetical protein
MEAVAILDKEIKAWLKKIQRCYWQEHGQLHPRTHESQQQKPFWAILHTLQNS